MHAFIIINYQINILEPNQSNSKERVMETMMPDPPPWHPGETTATRTGLASNLLEGIGVMFGARVDMSTAQTPGLGVSYVVGASYVVGVSYVVGASYVVDSMEASSSVVAAGVEANGLAVVITPCRIESSLPSTEPLLCCSSPCSRRLMAALDCVRPSQDCKPSCHM